MAGAGGGAWKVAYADFVTAMMAFFLVMWITAQSNAVKQAVAKYFQDPMSGGSKPAGGPPMLPMNKPGQVPGPSMIPSNKSGAAAGADKHKSGWYSSMGKNNKETIQENKEVAEVEAKKPNLYIIHNGDKRFMGTMVVFTDNSASLDNAGKNRLKLFIKEIRGKPQKIEIRGQAARLIPSSGRGDKDPWQISYDRCHSVMDFLVKQGIEPERIRLSQGGPYEPYSLGVDASQQMYNSRVEVFVLDEYAQDLMGTPDERSEQYAKPTNNDPQK
jgi:chemotaxis protein MotB